MPKRSSKPPADPNRAAKKLADQLARLSGEDQPPEPIPPDVSAAAAALGRRGGLKGGPARAKNLSAKRRSEIARRAAQRRWEKPPG